MHQYLSTSLKRWQGARTFYYRTTICIPETRTGTGRLRKRFARRPPKDLGHPITPQSCHESPSQKALRRSYQERSFEYVQYSAPTQSKTSYQGWGNVHD
ncbi:hypothetical protein BJV78DRAFT_190397 [Lactifluus subvellereus]|nr:hypothetical protein BJV78DRAFT_190397 [Lactifluus subvellereus]